MALLLTEADVQSLLDMPLAMDAVEEAFRRLADGSAISHSRQRIHLPGKCFLHYMAAGDGQANYVGLKIYTSARGGLRFLIPLFHAESGELLALIEADYLGQMRTGAATGVATRFLARTDARVAGIIGTGLQARTQLEAVAQARKLEKVRAYGRDTQRREQFAIEMSARLGLPVSAVSSAEEAARGADIVVTITTSTNPVVEGKWLEPGMHINAIGSNFAQKRELDTDAVLRCDLIAADSREQAKIEAGDLIQAFAGDESKWNSVREFGEIVAGKISGRTDPRQMTLFKSVGIAVEDIVLAGRIYALARERGVGREVPMWQKDAKSREVRI
ncbi:MAG TPA: ornithine cyclodeaminase family protein [Candidatus Limnocylindrales bacterium]|nr:ornithine cyclodeaminase family protein [Candidatus Limnocylindrales bacterium]